MTTSNDPQRDALPPSLEDTILEALDQRPADAGIDTVLVRFTEDHPIYRSAIHQLGQDFRAAEAHELGDAKSSRQPDAETDVDVVAHFRILNRLGMGGMGTVYRAEDTRLGRQVALKLLRPQVSADPGARQRFQREMLAASRLRHPNICTIYDVGEFEGEPYMAMQLVDGKSLAQHIADRRATGSQGRLPTRDEITQSIEWIETAANALHFAHQAGLVHRDIKPGNLMVAENTNSIIVLDFGLVRDESDTTSDLTASTDQLGTPRYMAPEQVSPKGRTIDHRTDVYALGITLFELLTLEPPFEGSTRAELFDAIREARPAHARQRNDSVSRDLDVVLSRAIDPDPNRRYDTAEQLALDLERVRRHEPIHARPASVSLKFFRWCQRNPVAAASIVLLTAALTITAILGVGWRDALARERAASAALDKSRSAERQQEAATHFERGVAALDRGAHSIASRAFQDAQRLGHPDQNAVALGLVASLEALSNSTLAAETLEPLAIQTDRELGRHAARVRLHAGYAALATDSKAAVALFRQAIELADGTDALTAGDLEFAKAMLAPDLVGLIAGLEKAIEHDPRHIIARTQLGVAAAVRGDPERALEIAEAMRLLVPEAPEAIALQVFGLSILGRIDEAETAIATSGWPDAEKRLLGIGIEVLRNLHSFCEWKIEGLVAEDPSLLDPDRGDGLGTSGLARKLLEFLAACRTADSGRGSISIRFAPQVDAWLKAWIKASVAILWRGATASVDDLQHDIAAGRSAGMQVQLASIIRTKMVGAINPDTARSNLAMLDRCHDLRGFEWGMPGLRRIHAIETLEAVYFAADGATDPDEKLRLRDRIRTTLRSSARRPGLTEDEFGLYLKYAKGASLPLATTLDIAQAWSEAFPKSPRPWFRLALHAENRGHDDTAVIHCKHALALDPNHADTKIVCDRAKARLAERQKPR